MTEPDRPLIVAVAVQHTEIRCPCCKSSRAADFTLLEPELRCYAVAGVTSNGELALNPDSEPADFWPAARIPPHWLFCRCGTDFPLPAGVQLDYGAAADLHYRADAYRYPAAAAALPIPGARIGPSTADAEAA